MQPGELGIEGRLAARVIKTGPISKALNKIRRPKQLTDHRPTAKEIVNASR